MAADGALTKGEAATIDRYWRAANYLSAGQIYLMDNPLLTEPLRPDHIKPRLLGHWGTSPGLNFIWAHLNRVISDVDATMMYVIGPGHGGPAALACTWLDGTYSPGLPERAAGWRRDEAAVQAVLVPGRGAQSRRAGDAGVDP